MKLIYENEMGRVTLSGGGKHAVRITACHGLSFPETEADTVRYPDTPGQIVTTISVLPRTITVAGDILDKTGREVSRIMGVFSVPGKLFVQSARFQRVILARTVSFLPEERRGGFVPYTLQLVCDDPYFSDVHPEEVPVATRVKHIASSMTLPAVFSTRTNSAKVVNRGSVRVMPCLSVTAESEATFPKGLVLENRTTGARLALSLTLSPKETLTIDTENRKIFTEKQTNLLGSLQSDCVMSAFFLVPGMNELVLSAEEEPAKLSASCRFYHRYGEAMV